MSSGWCTIESDPGVFTTLIESFGVQNVELSELWSLDEESLSALGKVYGLIFLFKWQAETSAGNGSSTSSTETNHTTNNNTTPPPDLFFARQTTHNACATQAILSVLMNASEEEDMVLGPTLTNFRSFTSAFSPELLGEAIGASEEIRLAHNSFARPDSFLADQTKRTAATEDDDVFHFVAYVPHRGDRGVYELDGLKEGPVRVGTVEEENKDNDQAWLSVARHAIQERITQYSSNEIKFNLMAIVRDRRVELNNKLAETNDNGNDDTAAARQQLQLQMEAQEQKRRQWKLENDRRRHNYLPFCVELLTLLAASGKLPDLTEQANDRTRAKRRKLMADKLAAAGQK